MLREEVWVDAVYPYLMLSELMLLRALVSSAQRLGPPMRFSSEEPRLLLTPLKNFVTIN